MRLVFVFIYSFTTFFTLICTTESDLKLIVSPTGHMYGAGAPILVRKVDDSLNLTCRLVDRSHETAQNYNISWNWQYSTGSNANRVMVVSLSHNEANLFFEFLKETDSGEYTCKCGELDLEQHVRVKVKAFKKYCSNKMFECSTGHCIPRRYVCDGKADCKHGVDEAEEYCGPDPCKDKIPCEDRCIPFSWCCDEGRDQNCTTKEKPTCCQYNKHFTGGTIQMNDMGFLQTTIYTVIGCAMAFMFIVTILVIAICRVHLKRTVISRCPLNHQHHRPGSPYRPTLPLYDLDMFVDRPEASGGLLVTYNINNGVQFVGRPIDPPPYCEIIDTPPREGPPPPYMSRENLTTRTPEAETTPEPEVEPEAQNVPQVEAELPKVTTALERQIERQNLEIRVPENVVCNLKGLNVLGLGKGLTLGLSKKPINPLLRNLENFGDELIRNHQATSSLGDVSKFQTSSNIPSYDICSSVPSVSGLSKLKNIKRSNVVPDVSDSESDSSCLENEALLQEPHRKQSDPELKARSASLSVDHQSNSSSFINNIAAVSKSFIGSLKKSTLEPDKPKNDRIVRISPNVGRKQNRPLLTQKSFDSSDKCRTSATGGSNSNFDKIVTNITHSMGDLSPVTSDLNYGDFDRRDVLTLPLRESFIGVRKEEL